MVDDPVAEDSSGRGPLPVVDAVPRFRVAAVVGRWVAVFAHLGLVHAAADGLDAPVGRARVAIVALPGTDDALALHLLEVLAEVELSRVDVVTALVVLRACAGGQGQDRNGDQDGHGAHGFLRVAQFTNWIVQSDHVCWIVRLSPCLGPNEWAQIRQNPLDLGTKMTAEHSTPRACCQSPTFKFALNKQKKYTYPHDIYLARCPRARILGN